MNESNVIQILLVDDNPGDIQLTREALKEGNVKHNLFAVNDGVDALAFLRQAGEHAHAFRPDLILLDLNMPRKNGYETLAEIKSDPEFRRIPVVILTTSKDEGDIRRAYDLHANCFITKPVNLDQFIKVIKDIENFWMTIVNLPSFDH